MSRRRHPIQPFDYSRFGEPLSHGPDRDEREHPRGIEYQDDSLSPINSDEDSYLHKPKNENFFMAKTTLVKANKQPERHLVKDAGYSSEFSKEAPYHQKGSATNSVEASNTTERLGRLEAMLETLIKRSVVTPNNQLVEKISSEQQQKDDLPYVLEPRRHSFTTSMWINKIQELSVANNWNEKSTIQYMESVMSGIIKAWYNGLATRDFSWPEWKLLITKTFPDNSDFVTTLKRLVTRLKQADETMMNYYFSKMYLVEACKISGEDAVSCLIDGLNNHNIQTQAKAQNFLTPETLYSQYLITLPDYLVDYAPPSTISSDTPTNWYYPGPNADEDHERESESPQKHHFNYEHPEILQDFDKEDAYNQEGSANQMEGFEPPPKRPGPVHSRLGLTRHKHRQHISQKICTSCFMRGHIAKQCRSVNKVLLCQTGNNISCYLKHCRVNKEPMVGFMDTGCDTVTVQESVARKLDLVVRPSVEMICGFGGGHVEALGKVQVELEVDGVVELVSGLVVPNEAQKVPIMIGQTFLHQKNITMIVENDTVRILRTTPFSYAPVK